MEKVAIFKRLSNKDRGHFSNHFTLNPVEQLDFGPTSLRIYRGGRSFSYPYSELSAEVLSTYTVKGYGSGAHAYIPQILVTIRGPGTSFSFDISNQFPDFKHGKEILNLVEQHMPLDMRKQTLKEVKKTHFKNGLLLFAVLFILAILAYRFNI